MKNLHEILNDRIESLDLDDDHVGIGCELETVRKEDGWPVAFWDIEELERDGVELTHEILVRVGSYSEEGDSQLPEIFNTLEGWFSELGLITSNTSEHSTNSRFDHEQREFTNFTLTK